MENLTVVVEQIVATVNSFLWDFALLFLLCGTGIFYTFSLKFIQVRKFKEGWKMLFGNFSLHGKNEGKGLSSFQVLTTAIAAGGPGAIFWMWLSAFFGMATIYAEAVMAQVTREEKNGVVVGGPVYYIKHIFKGGFGKFLAGFFSVAVILALGFMGNMVQANSIGSSFKNAFGISPVVTGIAIAIIAGIIFIGGIKRIARFTEKIVPIMAILYVLGCIVILAMNPAGLVQAVRDIFVGAFSPQAVGGGLLGVSVQKAIRFGVARGLFSNEAGMGSTPHAHATADVAHPSEQGIVAFMGVFIDTFVVLTCTALVIIASGLYTNGETAAALAQSAFNASLGNAGNIFIAFCMLFFAFTTIVGWYYFGEVNVRSLFGEKAVKVYAVIVVICVAVGATLKVDLVWNMSDMFNGLMVLPNLIALIPCVGIVRKLTKEYDAKKK